MYTILALDPGGTTGWAMYQATLVEATFVVKGKQVRGTEYYDEKWLCGQLGPDDHHLDLYNWLGHNHTSEYIIVCETFEYRGEDRPNIRLESREYIGVVKLFAQERGVDVEWQQPWVANAKEEKAFVGDRHVKHAGLWTPGKRHAMDAMRHLLYYMGTKQGRIDILKKMGK